MPGYLIIFDQPEQQRILRTSIERNTEFTEAINILEEKPKKVELCLIAFGTMIKYASLTYIGDKITTTRYRFRFSDFIQIPEISFDEIQSNIEIHNTELEYLFPFSIFELPNRENYLVSGSWNQLWTTIMKQRKEVVDSLQNLEQLQSDRLRNADYADETGYVTMAEEKDAVGLALSIFGLEKEITRTDNRPSEPAPFLKELKIKNQREDSMIIHDATSLGGDWNTIRQYQINATEFQKNTTGEILTLINVNRTKIEETLGVDLIYYNHRFHSFIMVQYKRLKGKKNLFSYQPGNDKSFDKEIGRMRYFKNKYPDSSDNLELKDYRLNSEAYYFKLCPVANFNPQSTDLIQGMYLPLEYLEILLMSSNVVGLKGRVTTNNVDRHINNTDFIKFVKDGWIGSRLKNTGILSGLINAGINDDKSVLLAYTRNATKTPTLFST